MAVGHTDSGCVRALPGVQVPSQQELAAVVVLCLGVGLATVSGGQLETSLLGLAVALAAIMTTSVYQASAQPRPGFVELLHTFSSSSYWACMLVSCRAATLGADLGGLEAEAAGAG